MKKAIIVDIISCLYAMLFLYTGIYKLMDQELFRVTIHKSPPLHEYTELIAIGIPVLEILIAVALMIPFFTRLCWPRKWGLYAGTGLMLIFTLYVGYMLKSGWQLPCSCGGIIKYMNWHQHFYFNTAFTILGALGIWLNSRQYNSSENRLSFSNAS